VVKVHGWLCRVRDVQEVVEVAENVRYQSQDLETDRKKTGSHRDKGLVRGHGKHWTERVMACEGTQMIVTETAADRRHFGVARDLMRQHGCYCYGIGVEQVTGPSNASVVQEKVLLIAC